MAGVTFIQKFLDGKDLGRVPQGASANNIITLQKYNILLNIKAIVLNIPMSLKILWCWVFFQLWVLNTPINYIFCPLHTFCFNKYLKDLKYFTKMWRLQKKYKNRFLHQNYFFPSPFKVMSPQMYQVILYMKVVQTSSIFCSYNSSMLYDDLVMLHIIIHQSERPNFNYVLLQNCHLRRIFHWEPCTCTCIEVPWDDICCDLALHK